MPLYESDADRENEEAIIVKMTAGSGATWKKLPEQRYAVDFAIFRNDVLVAFAEVKRRRNNKATYDTLMISLSKMLSGRELAQAYGVRFLVGIGWDDATAYWKMPADWEPVIVNWGGRTDRSNALDEEPVVHIPVGWFRNVEDSGGP